MPTSPDPTSSGTLDLYAGQLPHARRARPPDPLLDTGDALRVPLRPEAGDKARKRESRLGLRNIFGRHRGGSDADREPASPRDAAHKPGGIRASLAEISWTYGLHHSQGHRSELSLPSFSKSPPAGQSLKHKKSESGVRPQPNPEGIAAWSPPPLFKAYPQAIKHASLSACTAPVEVVLRLHNHKSSNSIAGLLSPNTPDIPEETMDDRAKRRHRRNPSGSASKFDWTTKIFILVTSGYLLQYAGEGTFDRLPERVLQLGKDSAAFASDAIPGRHWVLQVSSVAEPERVPSSHSLRARLPFRGQERRHTSTFLMVFDSAEDMEGWMATLRQNIEHLGGRKVLSETGKPKPGGQNPQLRTQTSQRTLVVRDPNRFSRVLPPDQPWTQNVPSSSPDSHLDTAHEEQPHEHAFDDNSTASFVSHDGRQLDGLRDSTTRLSYMSSSQRTMVTSVGSSPACSPIRDSFGELESPMPDRSPFEEHPPQPRMRPNAMAIIDRRQSLQAMNHVFEMRVAGAQSLPASSTFPVSGRPESIVSPTTAPQPFGVPHSAAKRHSFAKTAVGMPVQTTTSSLLGRMSARRPPPSALTINPRPLSLVEDQPSPALSSLSRSGTGTDSAGSPLSAVPITPSVVPSPLRSEHEAPPCEAKDGPTRDLARDSGVSTHDHGPEYSEQRPSSEPLEGEPQRHSLLLPSLKILQALDTPRSRSSLGAYDGIRSTTTAKPAPRVRRLSLSSPRQQPHTERPPSFLLSPPPRPPRPMRTDLSPRDTHHHHAPPPSLPSSPSSLLRPGPRSSQHLGLTAHLQAQSQAQGLALPQRRSMSHLGADDGLLLSPPPAPPPNKALPPPPAPPPNKALPPIPRRARTVVVPPGFF